MFTQTKGNCKSFTKDIKDYIRKGQNDKVESCIKGMNPSDLVDSSNTSLLHLAARYNNHILTKYLIDIKCNVNIQSKSMTTPLMVAATSSSFKTAKVLIEANADIYATNSTNRSALHLLLNNKKIPQYLINFCFEKVKSKSIHDLAVAEELFIASCPLSVVIHLKNANVTRMIIDRYDQIDPQQSQAAMDTALKFKDQENVSILLEKGVEVDISKTDAVLFLKNICTKQPCDKALLKLTSAFMDKVTDWNCLKEEDLKELHEIFRLGTKKQLKLFLQRNINDFVRNKFPGQDLFVNIFGNNDPYARKLLKQLDFDPNSRGKGGSTALHMVIESKFNVNDLQSVLDLGVNPNIPDFEGHVPLFFINTDMFGGYYIVENNEFDIPDENIAENNFGLEEVDIDLDEGGKLIELLLLAGADPQLDMNDVNDNVWYEDFEYLKMRLMLAQLAIDDSIGTPIKGTIREDMDNHPKIHTLYRTYCKQLEELKSVKVYGSITLYSMLVMDPRKIADKVRDREVLFHAIQVGSEIENLYLYYISKLKKSVIDTLHIMDLRLNASEFICEITGLPASQYIILENIISYLTYKDLLVFV